ncbi:MAG: glycosyltransferase protein [Hyphomicrobiales bacterium]|nr:glycosyltransferase protein [Hyphomicrobiales bacterium]
MTDHIAVVIPYFQRLPGLLRRAVASVANQDLTGDVEIEVLIVDDGSPIPAREDLADLPHPAHVRFKVIEQANRGISRARNAGLQAVAGDVQFVAFLDSDDVWHPGHLARALQALGGSGDFYFCDNGDGDQTTFSEKAYFSTKRYLTEARLVDSEEQIFQLDRDHAVSAFTREYLAQTSTIVLRKQAFGDLRFDLDLKWSGEDWLFWITCLTRTPHVFFSTRLGGACGRGVSINGSAYDWNSSKAITRILGEALFFRKLSRLPGLNEGDVAHAEAERRNRLGLFMHLLLRNFGRHPKVNAMALQTLVASDPVAPITALKAFVLRLKRQKSAAPQ